MDYDEVIEALNDLAGRQVVAAIQFSESTLDPIALLRGVLAPSAASPERFEVGEGTIIVRSEDLVDAGWVEGLGEEVAVRFDLQNIQVTVSPGTDDMADPLESEPGD